MNRNQNETGECGLRNSEFGIRNSDCLRGRAATFCHSAIRNPHSAFTLTELLVVITIIAILAGLITGAAFNALNRANQAAITLEIQQLNGSLEDFKNTYGAYPPNTVSPAGMVNNSATLIGDLHRTDLGLMLRRAFPRHREPDILIAKLIGDATIPGTPDAGDYLEDGMRGSEALVFWLGGFSKDTQFPISGPGGPSFRIVPTPVKVEDLTTRNRRYDFDLGRLGPRNSDNRFHDLPSGGDGRFITYEVTINGVDQTRRINFWRYTPSGSVEPIVYFDASRHRAQVQSGAATFVNNYDPWFVKLDTIPVTYRYALKRLNETGGSDRVEFVNQGKFQLLHCGIDDLWGDFTVFSTASANFVRFPTGPFLSDVADTVGNFMTGTLADEQE